MTSLEALLKLCDDPSPMVARKVAERLRDWGSGLWDDIEAQHLTVTSSQRAVLEDILGAQDDDALREDWHYLSAQFHDERYLENSLLCLCQWQSGPNSRARARQKLDELAMDFGDFEYDAQTGRHQASDAAALSQFLFEFKGLRGASNDDYYNPLHSNLLYALEARRALPITLACVFILVGRRVGLSIEGCSFPGHFLARDGASEQIFDPFNGGRLLSPREVGALAKVAPAEMSGPASAQDIVARVLRNLAVAYYRQQDRDKSAFMLSLLRVMESE